MDLNATTSNTNVAPSAKSVCHEWLSTYWTMACMDVTSLLPLACARRIIRPRAVGQVSQALERVSVFEGRWLEAPGFSSVDGGNIGWVSAGTRIQIAGHKRFSA